MSAESRAQSAAMPFDILGFSELMKPELTGLSVLTAICAFYLASGEYVDGWKLLYTALGTLLVGGAAGTLNQYIERHLDGLMKRTEKRPLPAGRLSPVAALSFGIVLSFSGFFILLSETNALTFFVALATLVSYLFVYTPLKRVTPWNTLIGAIPGALPVLIGWCAVRNEITLPAVIFFLILCAWQIPHFLSLGWMYRKDYARAGFKMLPVIDEQGSRTGRETLLYTIILLVASVLLTVVETAGYYYLVGAVVGGAIFLIPVYRFYRASQLTSEDTTVEKNSLSRRIFFASLAYLPLLMLLMVLDKA
jgi:protoheme IX farnesyltransferase